MMGSCFRTLFWSSLVLMLMMTIWGVIAVDLINPIVLDLANAGAFGDCSRCRRSFSSVFMANLTLFQTVVAGDSWGMIAIPCIEAEAWTAVIFVGSQMSLVFGVLSIIVAVIVDTFADTRANDLGKRAKEMEQIEKREKGELLRLFRQIDTDHSGALSFEELKEGARRIPEFSDWLRVLDIDQADLHQLFLIVDEDRSGEIDAEEFVEALFRLRHSESRTATRFVKQLVEKLHSRQTEFSKEIVDIYKYIDGKFVEQDKALQRAVEAGMRTLMEANKKVQRKQADHSLQQQDSFAQSDCIMQLRLQHHEESIEEAILARLRAQELLLEEAVGDAIERSVQSASAILVDALRAQLPEASGGSRQFSCDSLRGGGSRQGEWEVPPDRGRSSSPFSGLQEIRTLDPLLLPTTVTSTVAATSRSGDNLWIRGDSRGAVEPSSPLTSRRKALAGPQGMPSPRLHVGVLEGAHWVPRAPS